MLEFTEWGPQPTESALSVSSYAFWSEMAEKDNLWATTAGSSRDTSITSSESLRWVGPNQQVSRILVDVFKKIRQVKSICAQFGPEEIIVWTLLESYDRKARERVYKKELEICRRLGVQDFEFRVTSFDLVSADELVSTGSHEIYRRD
jgi:hypothetical protein